MRHCKLNYLLPSTSSKTNKAPAKTNAREMWNVAGKYSLEQSKRGSKPAWRETHRSQAQLRWWAVSANKVVVIHDIKIIPRDFSVWGICHTLILQLLCRDDVRFYISWCRPKYLYPWFHIRVASTIISSYDRSVH